PQSAIDRTRTDAHKQYFASAHFCHHRPLEQVIRPPFHQPVRVRQQSCSRNNKHARSIEGLESLKPPVKLTRHANQNPSQESAQPAAALFGFNESAADWNGLDLLSCCTFVKPEKRDRKSTRLNSSHVAISYAVFCLK